MRRKAIARNRFRRLTAVLVLPSLLIAIEACRNSPVRPSSSSDEVVHQYLVLELQLGERDPDSIDFFAANGPAISISPGNPPGLPALHAQAVGLRERLLRLPESPEFSSSRRQFLLAQVVALIARIEQLQGATRSFDQESTALFGVVAPADMGQGARREARAQIAHLLGEPRDPAAAYSAYDARFVVPPQKVAAVMDAALARCRAITLQHLALPSNEQVRVEYVSNKPWSAFSRYLGNEHSVIQVNMDYPLTIDRILNLACHEGYPGHHVFNLLRDLAVREKLQREELRVQPTFSPQSFASEAAATYAPSLALSAEERFRTERDLLLPLAGLKLAGSVDTALRRYLAVQALIDSLHTAEPAIARDYLDGALEFERAAQQLERETLMQHPEAALLYINEFRTYVLTYTLGADQVKAAIESGNPTETERWQRYMSLVTKP